MAVMGASLLGERLLLDRLHLLLDIDEAGEVGRPPALLVAE